MQSVTEIQDSCTHVGDSVAHGVIMGLHSSTWRSSRMEATSPSMMLRWFSMSSSICCTCHARPGK